MQFKHYFKHMDVSEALKTDVEEKISGRLGHFLDPSSIVHVNYKVENQTHCIHIGLHATDHAAIEAEEQSEDMHKSLEMALDNLERQLRKHKEKVIDHARRETKNEFFKDIPADVGS